MKSLKIFPTTVPGCLGRLIFLALILLYAGPRISSSQDSKQATPNAPAQSSSQTQPSLLPPIQLDGSAALQHLNQAISWYRHSTTGVQAVGLPTDAVYEDNAQSFGAEAIRLAFQSARAEGTLIAAQQKGPATNENSGETTQQQTLAKLQNKTSARIADLQSQIDGLNAKIPKTPASRRTDLLSQRDAAQGQMELQKALLDAIQKMLSFLETNGETTGGLVGSINQLAKSVPEVLGKGTASPKSTPAASVKPSPATSGGLINDAMTLYDYMRAVREIDHLIRETNETRAAADQMRTPLRAALRSTIQRSDQLGSQPPSGDRQTLQSEQAEFRQLTDRFRQLTDALLPLSQEMVVLDDAKANFSNWRSSIARESVYVLRSVLVRVFAILLALGTILFISEIWRRITFRYIADARRRRQFLVLRRVVISFLVGVVLVMGFLSEFSSLATFAGFVTAGIAVGLQAVLLSVAAYFFIIGRYGIRVGDRISVAGVTGDVVDIGLVRLYLAELAGTGVDFYPTGRIAVFSNSVLFQTTTPLFKQIPGTEYAWHEVVIKIAPQGNHKSTEDKLLKTVTEVYSKYQHAIELQHSSIERRLDIQVRTPHPEARLQFADDALELIVRYPIEIRRAPDIDEEMTRAVLQLVQSDLDLKAAVSGTPKIRSAIKG